MTTELFISDPHGEYEQLVANLAAVRADLPQGHEDRLHFVGDVYDRGPFPDKVVDALADQPNIDIQWGNHDMLWMGASLGQRGSVCNVVRICARYNNLNVLEDVYGMDLSSVRAFASSAYADDPCELFTPKNSENLSDAEKLEVARVQKAIAIIQFKVEARTIAENPSFGLEARNLLHCIDYDARTVEVGGTTYEMLDTYLPTVDPADPYALTPEEEAVMQACEQAFLDCAQLQEHIALFLERGGMYTISDSMLLFHACVPLNADGSLMEVDLCGQTLKGRALYDFVDEQVRAAFNSTDPDAQKQGRDMLWYLWLGAGSPLFAKDKMATFELYFCSDKGVRKEKKNAFYSLLDNQAALEGILTDFGLDPATSHMVCGHVPIKVKDGEDPVKCGGKVIMIDGGMSRAYQGTSGIAGLTLVSQDGALTLYSHEPVAQGGAASARAI